MPNFFGNANIRPNKLKPSPGPCTYEGHFEYWGDYLSLGISCQRRQDCPTYYDPDCGWCERHHKCWMWDESDTNADGEPIDAEYPPGISVTNCCYNDYDLFDQYGWDIS